MKCKGFLSLFLTVALIGTNMFAPLQAFAATATEKSTETAESSQVNLALHKTAVSSSDQNDGLGAAEAIDGDKSTRWGSSYGGDDPDPQWIYVDLGSATTVSSVKLFWENAYADQYSIQVSDNASDWTTVYDEKAGDGNEDDISFTPVSARYVRMYGTHRGSVYGYSLWEFEIYGPDEAPQPSGESVSVKLGSDYAENGISAHGGDGTAVNKSYLGVNGLETCPPWPGAQYVYANVSDDFIKGGSNPVYVTVSYYDGKAPGTSFFISYDGASNQWASTARTVLTGSGQWKTVTYVLPDARFENSENGSDFRLDTTAAVCFSQIQVTKSTETSTATSVAVTPSDVTMSLYGSRSLSAAVLDQHGYVMTGPSVSWSSADSSVAKVDGSGKVTAAGLGTTTVTATVAGGITGTTNVTVDDEPLSVTFGADAIDNGISVWTGDGSGYSVQTCDGVSGWATNPGYGIIYGNVNDNYIHGGHHKVEVTIQYYDAKMDGKQSFGISYESLTAAWASTPATTTYLTGTNTWKTVTYTLDDAKFANGENGGDFRISFSTSGICVHSVTVKKVPILTVDGSSSQTGNIFTDAMTPSVSLAFGNQFDAAEDLSVQYSVLDYAGSAVQSGSLDVALQANEENVARTLEFQSLPKGTYQLVVHAANADGSQNVSATFNFSVITDLTGKSVAQFLGQNHVPVDCYQSENPGLAWVFNQSGATRSRAALVYLTTGTTDDDYNTFVTNVKNVVTQDKGKIQYFEVGNESNGSFSADEYVKQLKLAYAAVKSVDPSVKVVAGVAFGYDSVWLKSLIDKGALDYADGMSFHLYTSQNPENENLVGDFKDLKNYIASKGITKQVDLLLTETGYATQDPGWGGMDEMTSAAYAAQLYVTGFVNQDLIHEIDWYDFMNDGTDPTSYETNGGIIRADATAKPSYVAFNAVANELAGASYVSSFNTLNSDTRIYKFHRASDNKDVLVVWSNSGSETIGLKLGSNTLHVGDMFGNFKDYSAVDGAVTLNVTEQPLYIEGNFDQDPQLAEAPAFSISTSSVTAAPGSDATVQITRAAGAENLSGTYAVTLPDGWQLKSGGQFSAGQTTDTLVFTAPDAADVASGIIRIQPCSDTGTAYTTLSVQSSISGLSTVSVSPQVNDSGDGYDLVVSLKNQSTKTALAGGKITILEPASLAGSQTFDAVAPSSTAVIKFPVSSLSVYNSTYVKLLIDKDDGTSQTIERNLTSLTAVKADPAISVDGVYHADEWKNAMSFTLNQASQVKGITDWGGPSDLSATTYLKWDSDYLYLDVSVTDPTHYNVYPPTQNWMGDSVQFAIDPGRAQGAGTVPHTENNVALRSDTGDVTTTGGFGAGGLSNSIIKVTRDDATNQTNYEMAVSWEDILPAGTKPSAGMDLGFSLLVNDNNGSGRRGWIEYMSGIGNSKDPTLYGDLILTDKTSLSLAQDSQPASLSVNPTSVTMNAGDSKTIDATVLDSGNNPISGAEVTWSTADANVATVDASGKITAVGEGSTTVTAACGSLSAHVDVTVNAKAVPTTLTADPAAVLLNIGDTKTVGTTLDDQFGNACTGESVTWSSNNPAVAAVDANGKITAVAQGKTTVTAKSAGVSADIDVIVAGAGTQIHRIDSASTPGSSQWLAYNQDQKYPFLTISGGGWWSDSWAWMYTGVGDPKNYVDFTFTGNSIAVFLSNLNIGGKASIYLDGELQETVDTYRNIDTIQRDGTVFLKTGLADGEHTVRVQDAGKSITSQAYDLINAFVYTTGDALIQTPTSLQVNPDSVSLSVGNSQPLQAAVLDQENRTIEGMQITWSSSDKDVASVDADGTVKALKTGTAKITAACGSLSAVSNITVTASANTAPVLNRVDAQRADEGKTISFTVSASDANGDALTYSVSGLPKGATFNSSTGVFQWTPTYSQAGDYQVTFQVSDGKASDQATVPIAVRNVTASELVGSLLSTVDGLKLNSVWSKVLSASLRQASSDLSKGRYVLAAADIGVFSVETGILTPCVLSSGTSRQLIASVNDILSAMWADAVVK